MPLPWPFDLQHVYFVVLVSFTLSLTHLRSTVPASPFYFKTSRLFTDAETTKTPRERSKLERMTSGRKTLPEDGIQLPEIKVAAETGTMSGPLVSGMPDREFRRKADFVQVIIRVVCLISSVTALSLMVTAKEGATISIYGFSLPVFSKWSFSDSFE